MTDDIEFFFQDSDYNLGTVQSSVRLQTNDVVKIFSAAIPPYLQGLLKHDPLKDAFVTLKVRSVVFSARTGRMVQEVELRTL